ncbi:calcium-activated chloride channel regulator 1-like [Acipenser oxyrinchus oxyrinchus]|uniref:Calcium-activated chloride channel regulator 1-like n=1 Tax=Acipenser oxyrinchus oxyrinchus TaxID=40147 RepID=A0AAD8D5B7_ACIOX|nr:calcium-activated chloride channel regulator 1-like [Acipenser oxyrinchus oxyrinchus]
MTSIRVLPLLLVLSLSGLAKGLNVQLENNGYKELVIAINPQVAEDTLILTKIKEMVTEASVYLFSASGGRFYFKDVKILLPLTWSNNYEKSRTESYVKAKVIIAEPYLKYGDDPYTLQYGGCGEEGLYIHLTPDFLLDDIFLSVYGPRGRVFVHEWAHLRWGVYDEYNEQKPFYISKDQKAEPTRCSKDITGITEALSCTGSYCTVQKCSIDPATSLPTGNCKFFPNKQQNTPASIMFLQSLPSVTQFCDDNTHNFEAPNMQNKICNYRSVWDVIKRSEDFNKSVPMTTTPPAPQFTLMRKGDQVVCLLLDVSGSMADFNRLNRMRQAAEVFLLQIIEPGSWVGIVSFESTGKVLKVLSQIEDEASRKVLAKALPDVASGGTEICKGLNTAFTVLRGDDSSTYGDEIVLLTDGEDTTVGTCLDDVRSSATIIHTIALGPNAAKELETMSNVTGVLQFSATDSLDSNGLIDAFAGISSGSGDLAAQSIQLESSGQKISNQAWFNGTVSIDKTVGNDTFFTVTWEKNEPNIYLTSPAGKTFTAANFTKDPVLNTARLLIPGTAETGDWQYSLFNKLNTQTVTMTVTSRAADTSVPPVTVSAHMNQDTSAGNAPMVVYAEVSQGFLPVLGANVTAFIETNSGNPYVLSLLDDGSGADAVKVDGIYSRYFTAFKGNGRYSLKVKVQGRDGTARLAVRRQGRAMYIPGYVENGKIELNPEKPPVNEDDFQINVGSFSRSTTGGTFTVAGMVGTTPPIFPPCKISDLEAELKHDAVSLSWTAPGENADQGTAKVYEIRMSKSLQKLRDDFSAAVLVDTSTLSPHAAGSKEEFGFLPDEITIQNGTILYFAARALGRTDVKSEVSNIARAAMIMPPNQPTEINPGSNITGIVLIVTGIVAGVCILISATLCIMKKKQQGRTSPVA